MRGGRKVNNKGEGEPLFVHVKDTHEIRAAFRPVNILADALENLFDLLVQFGAVGDDQDAAAGDVLANPFSEPYHDQTLAAALRMPDDAALAPLHARLSGADSRVLIVTAGLLDAGVEDDEVVHELEQALLVAELTEFPQQRIVTGARMGFAFLPPQPVFLRRFDYAVSESFRVVARHHKLDGRVERPDERFLLAVEALADALAHRH